MFKKKQNSKTTIILNQSKKTFNSMLCIFDSAIWQRVMVANTRTSRHDLMSSNAHAIE